MNYRQSQISPTPVAHLNLIMDFLMNTILFLNWALTLCSISISYSDRPFINSVQLSILFPLPINRWPVYKLLQIYGHITINVRDAAVEMSVSCCNCIDYNWALP